MNTRFVVILSIVMCTVFVAVAAVAYKAAKRSPERLIAMGDAQVAKGDFKKAEEAYSKAVNKDQTNAAYLEKWIDSMEQLTPETRQEYRSIYVNMYSGALQTLARAKGDDISGYERYLEEVYQRLRMFGADLTRWEEFAGLVGESIKTFEGGPEKAKSLRRYRGMARIGMLETGVQLTPEMRAEAEADFNAALELDPTDQEAVTGLATLMRDRARTFELAKQSEQAGAELAKARDLLATHMAAHGDAARVAADLVFMEMNTRLRDGKSALVALEEIKPLVVQQAEAIRQTPPDKLDPALLLRAAPLVWRTPGLGAEQVLALYDHALSHDPNDGFLLMQKGNFLQGAGRSEEAEQIFKRIIELPDRPISLKGLFLYSLRDQALSKQIDSLLGQLGPELTAAQRNEVIARAKQIRHQLAANVGSESALLLLVDGKLAYVQDELPAARTLLTQYTTTSPDGLAILMLAEVLRKQNNLGAARQEFERAEQRLQGDTRPLIGLARVELAEGKYELARQHLARVVELEPTNQAAAEMAETLTQVTKGTGSTDPVIRDLTAARELLVGEKRDLAGAAELLKSSVSANNHDPRVVSLLVQVQAAMNNRDGATQTVREALAVHPNDATLKSLETQLAFKDPIEAALAAIDLMQVDDIRKKLMRAEVFRRAGKQVEADQELEAAKAAEPENAMVVDYLLQRAVLRRDNAEVTRLAELGERKNLDNLRGLTFKARLAMYEQRFGEALTILRQAAELDRLNPMIHRYLGDVSIASGQADEAIKNYREALRLRSADVAVVKGLMRAQMRSEKGAEALATARENMALGEADSEFIEMWLSLEGQAPGGDPRRAQLFREQMLDARPGDSRNRVLLILSLIGGGKLDDAAAQLEQGKDTLDAPSKAELGARLMAARGDVDGAVNLLEAHVQSLPTAERNAQPYLLMAQLLATAGRNDDAMAALARGRAHQDTKTMAADRELGMLAFRLGKYEAALEAFNKALGGAEADEGNRLLKAVAETLMLLGRHAEAERTITQLGDTAEKDAELVMMLGQAAAGQKDAVRARRYFDDAVRLAPAEPLVYYRRADFVLATGDETRRGDALSDLREALRRDPKFAPARGLLIDSMLQAGMADEAVEELRKLVAADPSNDDARAQLVNTLMTRERIDEALRAANDALAAKPNSVPWMLSTATIYSGTGRFAEAVVLLKRAWELEKTPIVAGYYSSALLNQQPPDHLRATEVLSAPEAKVELAPAMLLLRAWANGTGNRPEQARADVLAAFKLTSPEDAGAVQNFLNGLLTAFKTSDAIQRVLKDLEPPGGHTGWFPIGIATMLQSNPEKRPQAIAIFEGQAASANPQIAGSANRFLGNISYVEKRYEDAVRYYRKALESNPQNGEVANNLAFALAVDLKRPSDAIPHAEVAARMLPRSSSAFDTLGTVYLELGRLPEAETALTRSLSLAANPLEKSSVYLHFAQLKLRQGDKSSAARFTEQLDTQVRGNADIAAAYADRVSELRKEIAGTK
ncbi:MAG: tetratricopeptide repeat protein [Phycisphaerales bacterium]|nr:tetratricopeptide repeat protein [Phycisphaerales bacterium]